MSHVVGELRRRKVPQGESVDEIEFCLMLQEGEVSIHAAYKRVLGEEIFQTC